MAIDLDIQWVWLGHANVCMSAIIRGSLNLTDFQEMVRRVGDAFVALIGPVIFDLRQAQWDLSNADINAVVAGFAQSAFGIDHKVALVCGRDIEQFGQLVYIASGVSNRGFKVRAFYDFDAAVKWLADEWNDS